jgi:hypothetical protein
MSLLNDSILTLITVLHLIVIIFVLIAPFSNSNYLLSLHAIIVPFIILHWWLNNNTCSLTVAEKFIRQQAYGETAKEDDCFSYKFIAPIYDFNKNHESYSLFTYILALGLWGTTIYNLSWKYKTGEIKNWEDFLHL